jgi:tripartite-type tricarboxylate transporter receptor subunit TctC
MRGARHSAWASVTSAVLLAITACGPAAAPAPTAAASTPAAASATPAPTANLYFQGKTIRIVVGFAPGAAWDQYSRLAAKHLGKQIPGNPTVIVENRPGAGSKLAATAITKTEPKDGTVIAHLGQGISLEQLADLPGVEFDIAKLQWLGSAAVDPIACIVRADLGIETVKDLMAGGKFAGRQVFMASTAAGSAIDYIPKSLNSIVGTNFKVVSGYTGVAPMDLAFQKKEVDGYCAGAGHFVDRNAQYFVAPNPFGRLIVITGPDGFDKTPLLDPKGLVPSLRDVPTDYSLSKGDALTLSQLLYAPQAATMPWAVGPDVPPDRVGLLREAWRKMFVDPEFLADAKLQNLVPIFSAGDKVQQVMRSIMASDPKIVTQLKVLMK